MQRVAYGILHMSYNTSSSGPASHSITLGISQAHSKSTDVFLHALVYSLAPFAHNKVPHYIL